MTTIKLRRGTAAEWTTANPILAAGEMGIETDTRKFKFGDGTTPWNTLAYASAEGGGGTGDVTAAGDNTFTGNNTFSGTTTFNNNVNINGANLEVAGAIKAATGNITNLQVPNTLTSSGEINAVSIKSTGIRSDDIQTTTNKKYLTEVDVDNQTIQVVDGKLHANLDNIPEPNLFKTPLVNSIFDITNISDLPIGETIINTSCYPTDYAKPYFGIKKDDGSNWFVGINPGTSTLFRVGYDKTIYVTLYKTYKVKIILNKISDTEIYAKGILYNLDNTTVLLESSFDNVSSGTTFKIYDYHTLNSNWISLAYDNSTLKVNDSGQLYADIETKQDILANGNGTKVVDNKVDIYQGTTGIQGLALYQNNGTITKNNDLSITFNNGACGYIFLENKGVNNDYEIILHQRYLDTHGPAEDSSINGVRCLPQDVVPTPGEGAQGECWFDTFSSPFRVVAIPNGGGVQQQTVDNINYIKYVIKGTNLTISYSSTGETYTELYTIAISSTYYINVCIANSPWQNDIANKWTKTTLYPDSYVLDKTTNTYLIKQGIANEGVAVATSTKYGLVLPDNSTIVSNNGVISSITPNNVVTTDTQQIISSTKTFFTTQYFKAGIGLNGETYNSIRVFKNDTPITLAQYAGDVYLGDLDNETVIQGSTKIKLDATTLTHKLDDSTEATIIDSNNISEYIPQSGGITIKDTFVDGTSGYRIWTDGYCEQWGIITSSTASTGQSVSFVKTFKSTPIVLLTQYLTSYSSTLYISTISTSNMVIRASRYSGNQENDDFTWKASGYLAEGQY